MDGAILSLALTSATQAATAFPNFIPSFSEIRRSDPERNDRLAGDVRMGEVAAITMTMGVATIATSLTGSMIPMLAGAFMSLIMVILYEYALTHDRPFERTK